ncbi:MAG TPA: transglycosylase SLT domain-containing protein [Burkholderiaceae bacterium]
MATLPDAFALGQRPVPTPAGGVAAYEPPNWRQVGMAGQEVANAGRELEQASGIVAATNDREDQQVAQAALTNLGNQRASLEFDPNTGFRNAKEGNAVGPGFVDSNTQRFNDATKAIRENLLNDNQRRIFDQHAQVQSMQFKSALLQHQAQQTEAFNDSTANNAVSLALRSMAQRPTDELNFQTSLAQVNNIVEQTAQRKGLPPEAVAETKAKYLDAAYSTRILSIMNGIPGAVQANPYLAEKMFQQVQDRLGPQAQVTLAREVQKGVQTVQARDTAQSFIFGRGATNPSELAPAAAGKPLEAVVLSNESGGQRFGPDGQLLTSPKGAQGEMQVMPATAKNPGFGVTPARDDSPEELARVGRDFLGAMTARYDNPALALAAYNAGPGQVDKWIAQNGDPRAGGSTLDWVSKIPFAETREYVAKGLKKLAAQQGQPDAVVSAPTANQLKTDLYARVQAARQVAEQQYPGDTAYADSVAARVESYGRTVIANQQSVEAGARDGLFQGITGSKPDGSDRPMSIDQLMTDPQQRANWEKATPETRMAIQNHFRAGGGDPPRTADSQKLLYQYLGKFSNDREGFANEDLSPLINVLPHGDFDRLATMQVQARNRQDREADKAVNLAHALTIASDYALKPIGLQVPTKDTPQSKRDQYDQFTGALREQLDLFQTQNKRVPNDQEIATMARNLTTMVQLPGTLWGTRDIRAFQVTPENQGQVTAKVPDDFRAGITAALTKASGKPPTEAQVQTAYLIHLRTPPRARVANGAP